MTVAVCLALSASANTERYSSLKIKSDTHTELQAVRGTDCILPVGWG